MTFLELLFGTTLIIPVFAAFIWSVSQVFRQTGLLRLAHGAAAIMTLLSIAAISYDVAYTGELAGVFLGAASALAIWKESGWSKAFPVILLILALLMILHVPFPGHG